MNINQAFPSKYLRAADIGDAQPVVTIEKVLMEEVGQGERKELKPVVYFAGKSKGLVLNKTNATMISRVAASDDTDDWKGVQIKLIAAEVEFQGELTMALRVREPKAKATKPAAAAAAVATAPTDDEIPF